MISENAVSSDKVVIHAPIERVWDVLLDFKSYEKWNGFCPSIKNDELVLDAAVDMMVDLGNGLSRQVEYLCRIKPLACIAWRMKNAPDDPVKAVRSQYLERVDDATCTYASVDEFSGPGKQAMMDAFATNVEAGFNRCAYDLKSHCEALHKELSG